MRFSFFRGGGMNIVRKERWLFIEKVFIVVFFNWFYIDFLFFFVNLWE